MNRPLLPCAIVLLALSTGCAVPTTRPSELVAGGGAPIAVSNATTPGLPPIEEPAPSRDVKPAGAGAAAGHARDDAQPTLTRGTDQLIAPAPQSRPLEGPAVELRFEDTAVREVVHAILGDLLKLSYLIHPPVDGRVSIAATAQLSPDDAVFLLETALQANGLVLVRDARGTYHVGKPEAMRGVAPAIRQVVDKVPLAPGYGAIVVQLRYIGAAEMASILRAVAPPEAIVRVDNVRNLLVLVGTRAQAEGWLSMVSTFDVNMLAGMSVGVFPLKYLTVRDVEAALQMMAPGAPRSSSSGAAAQAPAVAQPAAAGAEPHPLFGAVRVLPIERLNSVIVVTPRAAYLDEARRWIERLDRPGNSASESRLHVYAVRNGSAKHLGQVLGGIFGGGTSQGTAPGVAPGLTSVTGSTGATGRGAATGGAASAPPAAGQTVSALQLDGNMRVVADELNNAILFYGPSAQFERLEEALRRLDTPPTQVLIEASIIEVTLNDQLNYGLQWLFEEGRGGGSTGTSVLSRAAGGTLGGALAGFSYTLRNSAGNVRMILNALAEKSLVRVISTPSLMVLDNHTAQIAVGNQQPVLSGETLSAEGNVRTTTVQYKDTGVSLSVTPSVGAGDMVTMSINQAVTDVGAVDSATGQRSFLQRQISSKVGVRSGETVVLGGLIRDNSTEGSSGLPWLTEFPVLGALFGTKSHDAVRTELLVVITPRVARSDEDSRAISRDLRDRMRGLTPMGGSEPAPSALQPSSMAPGR